MLASVWLRFAEARSRHAIEYQGGKGAHATAARDAVKNWHAQPVWGTGEQGNGASAGGDWLCRGGGGGYAGGAAAGGGAVGAGQLVSLLTFPVIYKPSNLSAN